uniref:Uncharacterized protein n=1 Tax=Beta vulgaris subsp. maritima TaxID=350892 RepID=F4MLC8_BETVM|nr:hypothetical protein [Beta vulgaris subsp. maritima]
MENMCFFYHRASLLLPAQLSPLSSSLLLVGSPKPWEQSQGKPLQLQLFSYPEESYGHIPCPGEQVPPQQLYSKSLSLATLSFVSDLYRFLCTQSRNLEI